MTALKEFAEGQLTLGQYLRENGIQRVSTPEERQRWLRWADAGISLLGPGREFTADSVREFAGEPPHPNLVGAAFRKAHKDGLIEPAGWTEATRPERHASALRVWRRV